MKNKIELLAPAGNFESLMAAISAGANAVYLGIGEMNMRASATVNFSISDLKKIALTCHKNKVKVYVTLNTVVYDEEINEIKKIIDEIIKQKIDAIIASDMAVIKYANEVGVPVHISTQLSISNIESVKFFSQFSERIVLARELNLEQIKKITKDIKKRNIVGPNGKLMEIEVFAHGAMCVGISGRCQMSLYHYNQSANRGKCTQMCRRKYKVVDLETEKELELNNNLIMSRSDLCTLGFLPELIESGIKVLKFEGRGRGPEYVDMVIKTYRKALELIEENKFDQHFIEESLKNLKKVFNRGFSGGFYMGRSLDEWAKGDNNQSSEKKQLIGQISHFYPKPGVIEMSIKNEINLKSGDNFIITGPTTGVIRGNIKEIYIEDKKVILAKKDDVITFKISGKARKNDKVFLICSEDKSE